MFEWTGGIASAALLSHGRSRAINGENPMGEKGGGGMAASALGEGRKGSPCIPSIAPGEIKELARIDGTGVIRHIWMTVTDKLSEKNRFVFRDLVLRMYWDYCLYDELPEAAAYFHAQWRRSKITELGQDHVILDGVRGSGQYVGTFLALSALERYWWGEGEIKFYLDGDDKYPTICGTGTEDYFGGAWSFAALGGGKMVEQTYSTPFLGYPFYSRHDEGVHNDYHNDDCPPMRGLYRFHLPDPICFESDLKVTLQQIGSCHSGIFERQDDVATVAYWYQTEPHASFPQLPDRRGRWPR